MQRVYELTHVTVRNGAPYDAVLFRPVIRRKVIRTEHPIVVEAVVRGRQIPLTGAASVSDGVERTSILAMLQATNAFVASSLV